MLNRVKDRLTMDLLDCLSNFKVTTMNASWYYYSTKFEMMDRGKAGGAGEYNYQD